MDRINTDEECFGRWSGVRLPRPMPGRNRLKALPNPRIFTADYADHADEETLDASLNLPALSWFKGPAFCRNA